MKRSSFILCIALVIAGCKLGRTDKSDNANNSADVSSPNPPPKYVSCRRDVDGAASRCRQYDSANLNPILIDWIKSACGQSRNGFAGYAFFDAACPSENRLGECAPASDGEKDGSSDFYYQPQFTADTAAKDCAENNRIFTSITQP